MSCVAIFKVGDKKVSLDLETGPDSYLTDQEIIEILTKNPEKRQELCNLVQNKLYRQNIIEPVKVSDLIGLSGLRGNTDVESLSNEFPKVNFPQGVSANILLVNNLNIGKRNIKGRIINSNGEEVFIVQYSDDLKDLHRLAGFLQVRKQILDQSFIFDENSIYYKNLQECLKQRNKREQKVKDIYDMLLDFNQNKKKYQSLYFTDDKGKDESVYAYLTKINNIILQYSDRAIFMDPFVNVVNQLRNHQILMKDLLVMLHYMVLLSSITKIFQKSLISQHRKILRNSLVLMKLVKSYLKYFPMKMECLDMNSY